MAALRALFLGTVPEAIESVRMHFRDLQETYIHTSEELEKFLLDGSAAHIHIVLAGPDFSELPEAEVGQTLRMAFQKTPVYFVTDRSARFDRQDLMKNGFMEAFLLPIDREYMGQVIAHAASEAEHRVYSAIRLVDIEPGTKLDFQISVFLPANNRYIVYSAEGDELEKERLERLHEYKQNTVYVPINQITDFHRFSARRLKELSDDSLGSSRESATMKQEKLRKSVRELMLGMISESYSKHLNQGKKVVDHTKQIVRQYILLDDPTDWYKRLTAETGQRGDSFSHASSVSTYAALFAMATKAARPDEMAIAGLLHDVGISLLPAEVQSKRPDQMTKAELEVYKQHPRLSLEVVQSRKLIVTDGVLRAISQHHERWNGSGYPDALQFKRFSKEGQILAMADRFDYLTRAESNLAVMSPDQAIRQLDREHIADPDLIRELQIIFDRAQKAAS